MSYNGWDGLRIDGASYIEIRGFEIQGNASHITLAYAQAHQGEYATNPTISGNGIAVQSSTLSHHIRLLDNVIYEGGCGGIGTLNADYVTIDGNTIFHNAFWSPYACSGISHLVSGNFDDNPCVRMIIRNNLVYGNEEYIPFALQRQPFDHRRQRHHYRHLAQQRHQRQPHSLYRPHFDREQRSLRQWRAWHPRLPASDHVDIVNNTVYHSGRSPSIAAGRARRRYANARSPGRF